MNSKKRNVPGAAHGFVERLPGRRIIIWITSQHRLLPSRCVGQGRCVQRSENQIGICVNQAQRPRLCEWSFTVPRRRIIIGITSQHRLLPSWCVGQGRCVLWSENQPRIYVLQSENQIWICVNQAQRPQLGTKAHGETLLGRRIIVGNYFPASSPPKPVRWPGTLRITERKSNRDLS